MASFAKSKDPTKTEPMSNSRISPAKDRKGPCKICRKITTQTCILCHDVFYCCKKHEDDDYQFHKPNCLPFSIPMKRSLGSIVTQSNRSCSSGSIKGAIPLEDRYVVARKIIEPGTVIFKEKPILVAPNYVKIAKEPPQDTKKIYSFCLGCLEDFKGILDKDGKSLVFSTCPSCKLPLCKNCYVTKANDGHSQHECTAISDATRKLGDVLNVKNKSPYQNEDLILDLTVLRAILLQETNAPNWKAFINLKFNVRFTQSLRTTPEVVKKWVKAKTPISENYMEKNSKVNFFRLEDVKRIIALFSQKSMGNSRRRILYDFISWMPQSCQPNATKYKTKIKSKNNEISVMAVETILPDTVISINYIDSYEGGLLKASLDLFSTTAMVCGCEHCKQDLFDTSVGVVCDSEKCRGFISPKSIRIEPGKNLLDVNVYSPTRIWQCSSCKKQKKFSLIESHVMGTLNALMKDVADFEKKEAGKGGTVLRDALERRLHENHWLRVKLDKLLLESFNTQIGFGNEMLRYAVSKSKPNMFMYILEKKMAIYSGPLGRKGFLDKICQLRGSASEIAGVYSFDAFYTSFIHFIEKYKAECIKDSMSGDRKGQKTPSRADRDLKNIMTILDKVPISLSSSEDSKYRDYARIAEESLEAYRNVCDKGKTSQTANFLENCLQELLSSYAVHDRNFQTSMFKTTEKKASKRSLFGESYSGNVNMKFSNLHFDGSEEKGAQSPSSSSVEDDYNLSFSGSSSSDDSRYPRFRNSRPNYYRSQYSRDYDEEYGFPLDACPFV